MVSVMRNGFEYDFSTVFDLDMNQHAQVSKDRTQLFGDRIFQITEDTGRQFRRWLDGKHSKNEEHRTQQTPEMNCI